MDTITSINLYSNRQNRLYNVKKFIEYNIDLDLLTDSDMFEFTIKNPLGIYTGIFCKFDIVDIFINNKPVIKGAIDTTEYVWDSSDSYIRIVGRDLSAILIDNDAIPGTKLNVKPSIYIAEKCEEYGLKHKLDQSAAIVDKLIIGTGESEISIMNNILMNDRQRIWYIYDTLYCGYWNTNSKPQYTFVRGGLEVKNKIPIKSMKLKESGIDTKSEVRIYGSMNDGSEKVMGTAQNQWMIDKNIKRRSVRRSSNDDASSKYASNALQDIRESFKDDIELSITIKTEDLININTTAIVIDNITKLNSVFFIRSVSYRKNLSGSETTITMIPGDTTFEVLWEGQGTKDNGSITGTAGMTLDELIAFRRGY